MIVLVALGTSALAHVGMEDPPPRYPTDGFGANKSCPCGVSSNDSVCSDPLVRSDPNRSKTVTTYDAGATITISAHEVVGHSGRWRVAFDPDGADLDDFNDNILLDIADPGGSQGNVGQGDLWEFVVTLPNTPCTNCTLQLLQVMNGNTVDPVPDPTGASTYYQCADIVLVGDPMDTGTPEPTETAATGDTGETTTTTPPVTTPPATTPTDTAVTTVPVPMPEPELALEEGCGCDAVPTPAGGLAWLAVAAIGLRRRRRTA